MVAVGGWVAAMRGGGGGEWLCRYVYDSGTHVSDLAILDARDLAMVAVLRLPAHLAHSFHGIWVPENGDIRTDASP